LDSSGKPFSFVKSRACNNNSNVKCGSLLSFSSPVTSWTVWCSFVFGH
jgi:hypothetical protein